MEKQHKGAGHIMTGKQNEKDMKSKGKHKERKAKEKRKGTQNDRNMKGK